MAVQLLAVLGSLALLASWLAPNHYPPWTSFHSEAPAFTALACLVLARLLHPHPVRAGAAFVLFVPLALLIGAQWLGGWIYYRGDAAMSALFVLGAALAFWLGQNSDTLRKPDAFTWLAALVTTGACVAVLIGVLQWHGLEPSWGIYATDRGPNLRVFSNLAQPNHLATLCLTGVAMALWLHSRAVLNRWQLATMVAWLSLGMVLTESRAVLACAFALGLLLLWSRRLSPVHWSIIPAWWAALVAGYVLLPVLNEALYLLPAREEQIAQHGLRVTMWRQALAAIADAPWLGHGWRQTLLALKQAAAQVPGTLVTDYAHNVVLDVLVWVGVPLGVLLLGGFGFWAARSWLRIADTRQLLLLGAASPVLVHSLFEFPFAYAYFLFPVAWLLGALEASQRTGRAAGRLPSPSPGTWVRAQVFALVGIYIATCIVVVRDYLQVEQDYQVMRFELRKIGQRPPGHEAPDLLLLTQLGDLIELGRVEARPGMPPELLRRLGEASRRNGWATLDLTYATALGMNGRHEEASRELAHMRGTYGGESASQAYSMFRNFRVNHPELAPVVVP
ncbi:PglL family O-oligosaccharyltransferase [Ramlibacter pallidus]|uniref:O-antigen ligase C-terminal domain-containing protein n=1 Tax=Ramlibacter pallidus TaxID=2780087 RepID=A0ABR9S1M8_9BURK|nr:O-antigen ligase family protein [Ramlibacter pallidus]MBE7367408.1 O-antigen ligase C-terminal domain-containing protein [Ramlibacter pallidus]